MITVLLLTLSILCATMRNILSKELSDLKFGEKNFFLAQSVIFLSGCFFLMFTAGSFPTAISSTTMIYSVIYGILLILAQYCYTMALKSGNVGLCSTIYSLGFIFPTLSGTIFWNEKLSLFNTLGILTVIPAIVISGSKSFDKQKSPKNSGYIIPLFLAMFASGGLGIMQKVQQTSAYPGEKTLFLIASFAISGIISLIFYISKPKQTDSQLKSKKIIPALFTGIAFGMANTLNTTLAGKLDTSIFFPVLNIGTILFSMLSGIIFFKDKISARDISVLILAVLSIILITVF